MKKYEEQEIDYDTGLPIKKEKAHKREDVIRLALLFDKMAFDFFGKKIVTPDSYWIVLSAINKHKMKPKGIEKLYQDWFNNPNIQPEHKVKLSWCLGKDNINSFKILN